jgi:DNA-binding transcriptional MerR regulator
MPLSRTRDYLSIGEVLDSLRADFPDISISKIRFLESEGLISPERTPSGYRKFYEGDLDRLKQVLLMQRDHFMPLKVIKEKLEHGDLALPEPVASIRRNGSATALEESPNTQIADVALSRDELKGASGLTESQLANLEDFGILKPTDGAPYDGDALLVAKAAHGFFELGVGARHLRMYRQFAEREINFFEQIVTPVAGKKDTQGLERAASTARRLEQLGKTMHHALLQASVRDIV